jgi:hypothetical protein
MAYINANDVAQIRKELKEKFPKFKFGVRKGAGSLSVDVTIKSGPADFVEPSGRGYIQVNQYHLGNYGPHEKFLSEIVNIIKTAPSRGEGFHKGDVWYDRSDAMTDYFDTAFYFHINVGSWNKPYVRTK